MPAAFQRRQRFKDVIDLITRETAITGSARKIG
jgi:hypothetical protein